MSEKSSALNSARAPLLLTGGSFLLSILKCFDGNGRKGSCKRSDSIDVFNIHLVAPFKSKVGGSRRSFNSGGVTSQNSKSSLSTGAGDISICKKFDGVFGNAKRVAL